MKRNILITLLSVSSLGVLAQGNYAPFSQMGLGDIDNNYYNRTSGLANTGIAYRSNSFLVNNNPASFSALSNQYFNVEMGIRGSLVNYYGTPVDPSSKQSGDITFRKFAFGIKLAKHWGTSVGLAPYATQNYQFNVPYYFAGSATQIANQSYEGHGSINRVYWANSYEFFNHVSLGIDAGYLFGQLNQKNAVQNPGGNGASLVSTTNNVNLRNMQVNYGIQVYGKLGKKWDYSLGGTFSNKTSLLATTTQLVLDNDSVTQQDVVLGQQNLTLPNTFGAGFALTHNSKFTFVGDYKYQAWTDQAKMNNYPGKDYSLVNSQRGSLGFEISKKKTFYNSKVELSYFQSGIYYGSSYLQINGKQIDDKGITVGFGVNSLKNLLAYNIVFQYGIRGTQSNNLVEERYANVTFLINYGAIWFTRGRKFN